MQPGPEEKPPGWRLCPMVKKGLHNLPEDIVTAYRHPRTELNQKLISHISPFNIYIYQIHERNSTSHVP